MLMIAVQHTSQGISELFLAFFSYIGVAFSHFTWRDALDIALLSVILFFLFRFLTNRKAGVLLVGIAVCTIILLVSGLLELKAVYFIFSGLFRIGALALIIIFQPEIRDALEKIGSGSLGGIMSIRESSKRRRAYSAAIDSICVAVKELSASKTGALIVMTRTTRLDEILQTGITINADVNSFLIRNLFFNKAPLHDGAIVIDNARIVAAGCLLPLTRRTDVDSDLGTRHRAAIGMSETSDAVIIVVSEETGTISVAYDCALMRDFTPESLKAFLLKKIANEATETSGKR